MVAADGRRRCRCRRAQHLLHPGERRQQALRPPRPPQGAQGPPARAADRGRRLPGPEGPGPDPAAGAVGRRRVRHPQPRRTPPTCCSGPAREGPVSRSSKRPRATTPSSRPRCRSGASRPTPPGSPSRSAATTPAPSASCRPCAGREISRPFGQIVGEVAGPGRGRDGRGDAARAERQLLRPRHHHRPARRGGLARRRRPGPAGVGGGGRRPRARPLFADLLRAVAGVDGIRRVRYTSPHPKDLRPETIEAMADEPAVCEHLHLPLQSGSDRTLAAMHRGYTAERYLDRLAAARAAIADLAVTTDIIVGFPGRDRGRLRADPRGGGRGRVRQRLHLHLLAPAGHRGGGPDRRSSWPPDVIAERFERLRVVVERSALARHEARVGRVEEVLVEGPSKRDPAMTSGRTRQNKLVHFRRAAAGRDLRRGAGRPGPRRTSWPASWSRSRPGPATRRGSRWSAV